MTTTATDTGESGAGPRLAAATRAPGPADGLARTRRFCEATRTAAEAAAAIGCEPNQICSADVRERTE